MSQKPAQTIRLGRVKAVIWTNQTEKGPRSSVQIARLYRDGEEWKETHSFRSASSPGWLFTISTLTSG